MGVVAVARSVVRPADQQGVRGHVASTGWAIPIFCASCPRCGRSLLTLQALAPKSTKPTTPDSAWLLQTQPHI